MTEVKLTINENKIPLNELMNNMLTNLILAYLKSAKKVPEEIKNIKVEITL